MKINCRSSPPLEDFTSIGCRQDEPERYICGPFHFLQKHLVSGKNSITDAIEERGEAMSAIPSRFVAVLGAVCGPAILAGCVATADPDQVIGSCSELKGGTVAASSIGLPTRGATVTATEYVPPVSDSPKSHQGYCKVLGD